MARGRISSGCKAQLPPGCEAKIYSTRLTEHFHEFVMTAEKSAQANDVGPAIDVQDHFARNGLDWGVGDLIVANGSLNLLGEFLACVLDVRDQNQRRVVRSIVLVQPAGSPDEKKVLSAIGEAVGRWRGQKPTAEEEVIVSRALRVMSPATLETRACLK
jgi:hypothetical protein